MIRGLLFVLLSFNLFLGCKDPVDLTSIDEPSGNYTINRVEIHSSRGNTENWVFKGKNIVITSDFMQGSDVEIRFPLEKEDVESVVTGDSGTMITDDRMLLQGNVKYEDSLRVITCQRLTYRIASDRLEIPGEFVFIDRKNGRKTKGFHLTSENNLVKIYIERIDEMSIEVDKGEFFE